MDKRLAPAFINRGICGAMPFAFQLYEVYHRIGRLGRNELNVKERKKVFIYDTIELLV